MYVLGTLNAIPFDKQIYLFTSAKAQWGLLKFEVRSPKVQLRIAAKKLIRGIPIDLSLGHNKKSPPNSIRPPQKLVKPNPNSIVT